MLIMKHFSYKPLENVADCIPNRLLGEVGVGGPDNHNPGINVTIVLFFLLFRGVRFGGGYHRHRGVFGGGGVLDRLGGFGRLLISESVMNVHEVLKQAIFLVN